MKNLKEMLERSPLHLCALCVKKDLLFALLDLADGVHDIGF